METNGEAQDLLGDAVAESVNAKATENPGKTTKTEGVVDPGKSPSKEKPAWTAQLPGDLKDSASLTKFSNLGDLGKAYVELEGRLGKSVVLPGEEASEEERAEFLKKIGRPETPEGYTLKLPESADPEAMKALKQAAFEAGMTDTQFGRFVVSQAGMFLKKTAADTEVAKAAAIEAAKEATKVLKSEWGNDFDDNFKVIGRFVTENGGDDLLAKFRKAGLASDPDVAKLLFKAGKQAIEGKAVSGRVGGPPASAGQLTYK